MKHPYQKVTDGTVCNWEINPAGTMQDLNQLRQDLRDAVHILFVRSSDQPCPFCEWQADWNSLEPQIHPEDCEAMLLLNRPSVRAVMEEKG